MLMLALQFGSDYGPQFLGALVGAWLGQITFAKRAARQVFIEEHAKLPCPYMEKAA